MTKERNEASEKSLPDTVDNDILESILDYENREEYCTTVHVRFCLMTLGLASCSTGLFISNAVTQSWFFLAGHCICITATSDEQHDPEFVRKQREFGRKQRGYSLPSNSIPMCGLVRGIANTTNRISKAANCCAKTQTEQPDSPTMSRQ